MPYAKAPKVVRKMAVALGPEVGIRRAKRTGAKPPGGGPSCTTGISLMLAIPGLFRTRDSVIFGPGSGRRYARLAELELPAGIKRAEAVARVSGPCCGRRRCVVNWDGDANPLGHQDLGERMTRQFRGLQGLICKSVSLFSEREREWSWA
jgi:hypothetical protein